MELQEVLRKFKEVAYQACCEQYGLNYKFRHLDDTHWNLIGSKLELVMAVLDGVAEALSQTFNLSFLKDATGDARKNYVITVQQLCPKEFYDSYKSFFFQVFKGENLNSQHFLVNYNHKNLYSILEKMEL